MVDNGRQMRRQSSDFGEINNLQQDVNNSQYDSNFDSIFHNWREPLKCSGRGKVIGCPVCEKIDKQGYVETKPDSRIRKEFGEIIPYNIGIIGDAHSHIANIAKLMGDNPDILEWICIGDLGLFHDIESAKKDEKALKHSRNLIEKYIDTPPKPLPKRLLVLKGNHEDFDYIHSDWFKELNIWYIPQGHITTINKFTIGFLGGIWSPKKSKLDSSKFKSRERRFYTFEEIESLNTYKHSINMLITHEAAKGVLPTNGRIAHDEGKPALKELLDNIKPIYYIHGHHHLNYSTNIVNEFDHDTAVIGLGNFGSNLKSFIKINSITGELV